MVMVLQVLSKSLIVAIRIILIVRKHNRLTMKSTPLLK